MQETSRAKQAKADYISMGPGRSLEKLLGRYRLDPNPSPTNRLPTLKGWSKTFGWVAAAEAHDEAQRKQAIADAETARQAALERRIEILNSGFALDHERVLALNSVATVLLQLIEGHSLDEGTIRQFRGLLDDIAKEVGGRSQKVDIDLPKEITVKVIKSASLDDI